MRRGQRLAAEQAYGVKDHDGRVKHRADRLTKAPVYKRFFWPHPYAREAGLLWRKVVVGYRYFDERGREVDFP